MKLAPKVTAPSDAALVPKPLRRPRNATATRTASIDVTSRNVGIPPASIGTRFATTLPSTIEVGGGLRPLSLTASFQYPSGTRCCSVRMSASKADQRDDEKRERAPALHEARAASTVLSASTSPRSRTKPVIRGEAPSAI